MKMRFKLLAAVAGGACALAARAKPTFYLPERLYAAPGLELNVYYSTVFDSIVPQNYAFQAFCEKGRAEVSRWCFTPTANDVGKCYRLVINAWNDDGRVASATSTVCVAAMPADKKRRMTLALLGDSLTNCKFQDHVQRVMWGTGHSGYRPVGLRAPMDKGGAHFDGYGGYTFRTFLTRYKVSDEEITNIQDAAEREQLKALGAPEKIIHAWQRDLLRSPLVRFDGGKKIVDVKNWLNKINGGEPPDVVIIELGVNSIANYVGETDELRGRLRAEVLPGARELISTLRQEIPNATYLLCTLPIGTSQDGFGANYGATLNEIQHRKTMFALNREFDAFVKASNDPKLRLLPLAHAVDPMEGFIRERRKLSARSELEVMKNVNAVHPSAVGGLQMGDAIAAMLMGMYAEADENK